MNERFKKIREEFGFSQEKFGEIIGLSKSGISNIESGQRKVTEKHIKLLSSELNINPDWIRTGEGSMKIAPDIFSLDDYAKQKGLSEFEFEIIKGYMELDKDLRKGLMAHLKSIFNKHEKEPDEEDLFPPRVAEEVKEYSSKEPSVEKLDDEYKKCLIQCSKTGCLCFEWHRRHTQSSLGKNVEI